MTTYVGACSQLVWVRDYFDYSGIYSNYFSYFYYKKVVLKLKGKASKGEKDFVLARVSHIPTNVKNEMGKSDRHESRSLERFRKKNRQKGLTK